MAYYVTTPIYYVNAAPHLGHAYTTIGADILARHMRQRGEEVFFLTGTDEHGEPVAQAAEKLGVTPKELADKNAERFIALGPRLNVTNDFFIRTSDPRHKRAVQDVMQRIHDNGFTYKGKYEGLYCPRCADFKTEQEMGPDQTCPIHKIPLEHKSEENWFFQLSAFQERLEALYAERPDFVAPGSRYNEALSFIKGGLNDISLSRSQLTWGVEVPWDEGHVFYVWFDALLNYYTALSFAREGEDLTEQFWPAFHIIGKDILKFHAVFWPAMLMAADIELPREIFIHGFLLMKTAGEDVQVARQRARPVRGHRPLRHRRAALLLLPRGAVRRRTAASRPAASRSATSSELANDFGNLASRTTNMVARYCDGAAPTVDLDPVLGADFDGLLEDGVGAARQGGDHAGAGADLDARAAAEPLRRGDGAVEAGQGRDARPTSCTRRCGPWPRACGS